MTSDQTTQQASTPAPRTIAGRYVLRAELGRGGMGVVWRAEDRVIGRPVAIKELRLPDGAEGATFGERVLREVRTGGRLNDPAVVTVFDVISEQGGTFIVMELVEAPTLAELVRAHGPLPPAQVAAIGRQVLGALQAAHAAGIVHRDVKPGNIMVAPNGRVKLTDFGIAQAIDDPRLTTSGMIVGSPAFMAPERVAGKDAVPASDLWSLGATLFFAVEGTLAFERQTTAATLHAILHEIPYLTRTRGPLASAIMGLLVASPEGRVSAAQADQLLGMAGTVEAPPTPPAGQASVWTGPAPTLAGPVPPSRGRRKALTRALTIAGALFAVALLVTGLLLGKAWGTPDPDPAMLPTYTYGAQGQIPALRTGSYACTKTPLTEGKALGQGDWVDCDDLHYTEFYDAAGAYGSSDSKAVKAQYPDKLREWAEAQCRMTFYSNAVPAARRADLTYRTLVPSQQAWETQSTSDYSDQPVRKVYCLLAKRDNTAFAGGVASALK
ncbi:protein kinase [Amycolatopsis rhizosphaerae]|uniref:non-specific serine/threonine protein kinase n=1 Tax=Amycolatopsis rhizosphaerae TaxID=2053003 RepID=A0A558BWL5_9PSEU|nr:serine/threonine-protein kinase [Amycolatopsis rhizosphaerae]TVT40881.1 protein kinase [Amycolatopsis rhizosphaerae]